MISAALLQPAVLAGLRACYLAMRPPVLLVPQAIAPETAAALRERVAAAGLRRYWLADRGRYERNDDHAEPALLYALHTLAQAVAQQRLVPQPHRWTRLRAGDYAC